MGDLYDVHNGLSKGRKFFGSGYPFLSFKTVFNNYFLPPKLSELVQANEKEQKGYNIKRGDVFVTRTSETPEELGMSSVALKDYPFATYNGFTKRLRPKDMSLVCPEFIGYYLRSPKFRALFYGLASSMSTRASLVNGDLLGMSVFLPSFETQERIASLLSSLDDKISVNKKICENLEAQAQALFKHWFIDFAPFKNGKFVESELGMIPEGWRVGTLGEIAEVSSGKRPIKRFDTETEEHNVPLIGASCVMGYTNEAFMSKKILLTGRVGTLGVIQRFRSACWPSDNTLVLTTQFYEFVYQILKTLNYSGMNRGTSQPLITQGDLKNTSIIMPPDEIIQEYENVVSKLMSLIEYNNKESKIISTLRDTLLPRLMSGEIKL